MKRLAQFAQFALLALLALGAAACTHSELPAASPARSKKQAATPDETRSRPTRSQVARGPEGTEIVPAEAWVYAYLECEGIPYAEMGDAIVRSRSLLEQQKIEPAGACRSVYLDDPAEVDAARMRFRVGFPITGDALPQKPLRRAQMEAVLTARILHRGDYDEAFQLRCYERIPAALRKAGYESAGPIIEIYRYPADETDPAKWVTEVRYPVKKKGAVKPAAAAPVAR